VKALFDTSVWIDHLRNGTLDEVVSEMRGRVVLAMDAVTAAELRAGPTSIRERRAVDRLLAPFDRAERVWVAGLGDYARAGRALSTLRSSGRTLRRPAGALLDALIAAVAAREGAWLFTHNSADFEKLATVLPFAHGTVSNLRAMLRSARHSRLIPDPTRQP